MNRRALESLYFSFILPCLEYASVVWDGCTQTDRDLESIQLAAARIITGAMSRTSHSKIYEETGWETLSERRRKQKLVLMFKIVNGLAPEYLCNLIPQTAGERNAYNIRSRQTITPPIARKNIHYNSFLPSTIREWNLLSRSIKNSENVDDFKRKLNKSKPKRNEVFYFGERKIAIIHARMRMGCSQLNSDLYKMGLIASPLCPCGHSTEDYFHYFFQCSKYPIQRDKLQTEITPLAPFNLKTLLFGISGGNKSANYDIFRSVHCYIKSTERFKD